jgi:hypothetical protein
MQNYNSRLSMLTPIYDHNMPINNPPTAIAPAATPIRAAAFSVSTGAPSELVPTEFEVVPVESEVVVVASVVPVSVTVVSAASEIVTSDCVTDTMAVPSLVIVVLLSTVTVPPSDPMLPLAPGTAPEAPVGSMQPEMGPRFAQALY